MHASARFLLAFLAGMALLQSLPALANDAAGSAVSVLPQATARTGATSETLASGDDIFMGQQLITGQSGQVQVVFKDNTHLVIGPGSTLVISQYLMRDGGTANKFVINALSGSFRFVTGNSQKSAYRIDTPTGTLAVRGTAFDFEVDKRSRQTSVVLYHGSVGLCEARGDCVWMSDACSVGVLPADEQPDVLHANDHRRPPILGEFPYLRSQQPLRQDFRVPGIATCAPHHAAAEAPPVSTPSPPLAASIVPPTKPPCDPPCPPPPCGGAEGDRPHPEGEHEHRGDGPHPEHRSEGGPHPEHH